MATNPHPFPNNLPPMPAIARILSRFDRAQLEGFISVAIDLADAMDGDENLEDGGDAEQASWGNAPTQLGMIAHCMDWHHDDAEDDDPAGGAIDDEPHDPQGDYDSGELIGGGGSRT